MRPDENMLLLIFLKKESNWRIKSKVPKWIEVAPQKLSLLYLCYASHQRSISQMPCFLTVAPQSLTPMQKSPRVLGVCQPPKPSLRL